MSPLPSQSRGKPTTSPSHLMQPPACSSMLCDRELVSATSCLCNKNTASTSIL